MDSLINGDYFLYEIVNLAFLTLQLADSPKFSENGIEKMTKLNGFLIIYFKENFAFKLLFYSLNLLNQSIYKFFLAMNMINNWDFKTVVPSTV